MPDLIPEEQPLAQQIAFEKCLARGGGPNGPYDPEAAVGDFWQAAGELIARRGQHPAAPSNWEVMYGTQNIIRTKVLQEVQSRLEKRGTGGRNQAADNTIFVPLRDATITALGRRDYGFAIEMFSECFEAVREFEDDNHCEVHKGAPTFNVAIAYLRANDFSAAMHYFQLAQEETQETTGDHGWGVYDSGLFVANYWNLLDLYEAEQPMPLYSEFWGTPFGTASSRHDWTALSDHSKLLYIVLNAERISYRRLGPHPHMPTSESFSLSYWNLIADLVRLLETELTERHVIGNGLWSKIVSGVNNSPVAGFKPAITSISNGHVVKNTADFNIHFPALRTIILDPHETQPRRIAAAACLAGVTRNQVQHHVDTGMVIFSDRAAAVFTAEVLLCLCRVDAWAVP
ncbi:tetratricopeptide repeat protein [Planctomicrobium sp. SH661]|uniref:tetratricopeptide repeat protein n=1 Tax=Planctomicrobium sp. SH661 TaxID=3448124 RepID=UPI003F5CBB0D